jgi:hypothetical protein
MARRGVIATGPISGKRTSLGKAVWLGRKDANLRMPESKFALPVPGQSYAVPTSEETQAISPCPGPLGPVTSKTVLARLGPKLGPTGPATSAFRTRNDRSREKRSFLASSGEGNL